MKYLLSTTFFVFLLSNAYILHMNKKAAVKRSAFRWWLAVFATFMVVYFSIVVADKALLFVVLPVLGGLVFGMLRFTKFCDWCGKIVHTNLPFVDKNRCPRCGSSIS